MSSPDLYVGSLDREQAFLDACQQLEDALQRLPQSRSAARTCASVIFQLVEDGRKALVEQLRNYGYSTNLAYLVPKAPLPAGDNALREDASVQLPHLDNMVATDVAGLMSYTVARVAGDEVTVGQLIRYVRNVQGGAHSGSLEKAWQRRLAASAETWTKAVAPGADPRLYGPAMRVAAASVLRGLAPLRRRVRRERGIVGEDEQGLPELIDSLNDVSVEGPPNPLFARLSPRDREAPPNAAWLGFVREHHALEAASRGRTSWYQVDDLWICLGTMPVLSARDPYVTLAEFRGTRPSEMRLTHGLRVFPIQDVALASLVDPATAFAVTLLRYGIPYRVNGRRALFCADHFVAQQLPTGGPGQVRLSDSELKALIPDIEPAPHDHFVMPQHVKAATDGFRVAWAYVLDIGTYASDMRRRR